MLVEVGMGTPTTAVQSVLTSVVVGVPIVRTNSSVGQVNSMVVVPGHGIVTAVAGVWNEWTEDGGQESVIGLTTGGKLMVMVVGPVAVTSVKYGVTNGMKSVPLVTGPDTHGPSILDHSEGGPSVILGHGGRVRVRLVLLPSSPVTVTVTGGTLMLGETTKPYPVDWSDVTLTLENPIESVVMGSGWSVTLVVVPIPEPT